MSGGREKEQGFPGDKWGLAEEKQLHNDLKMKVWTCAGNGKNTSGAAGGHGSRAAESKAQRGKATSLRLHSQLVAERKYELKHVGLQSLCP